MAQGDTAAFEELYRLEMAAVLRTVVAVLRDRAQAEEVAQETMFKIWRCAGQFDPSLGAGRPWIARIARSKGVDRVRMHVHARDREYTYTVLRPLAEVDAVAETVLAGMDNQRVQLALLQVSEVQREALVLGFFSALSYPQIAAALGVPLGTLKSRIRDGLRKLRPLLADQPDEDESLPVDLVA